MKTLPRSLQEEIARRLDPKTAARMRSVSKEMKNVIDTTWGPTGSYQRKTGRFQKRFSVKGMFMCYVKHMDAFRKLGDYFRKSYGIDLEFFKSMKKSYKKNSLFRDFKSMTTVCTLDEYRAEVRRILRNDLAPSDYEDVVPELWKEKCQRKRDIRRRVIRLIKAWAQESPTSPYADTLTLVRRRKVRYIPQEEREHKDRLMDAIIVQLIVQNPYDDPTRKILGKNGTPLSLDAKVSYVVRQCCTSLLDRKP